MNHYSYLVLISILFYQTTTTVNAQVRFKKEIPQKSLSETQGKLKELEGKKGIENDSLRLELLNSMSVLYRKKSKDSSLYFAEKALIEARALNLKNMIAVSMFNKATTIEFYKEYDSAEIIFLEWMEVRKSINDDEYRWGLDEMRRFYIDHKQTNKLEKIEEEWMVVLDRQLDQRHISPWNNNEGTTPEEDYWYSMVPVFKYLVDKGHYFIAEKSFLHMAQKCPSCCDWNSRLIPYFLSEAKMLRESDTINLDILYDHWFNAFKKYDPGKKVALSTFKSLGRKFAAGYTYDNYFDKYYTLMLNYTYKIGGDSASYQMLKETLKQYVNNQIIKVKLFLMMLNTCQNIKDSKGIEISYSNLDKAIGDYIRRQDKKSDLKIVLQQAKAKNKNSRFKKWCNSKIKMLD